MPMSLRLRRLVRTPNSEQFTLYRADQTGSPTSVGKVDLHFTPDGVFGTLLVWDEELLSWSDGELNEFLKGLIEDLVEPQGMADVYAVECFAPSLETYRFLTNSEEDEGEDGEAPAMVEISEDEWEESAAEDVLDDEFEDVEEDIILEEDE